MAENVSLVEVRKDGEAIHVHPTTVAAHVLLGWRVATEPTPEPAPVVPIPDQRPPPVEPKQPAKPRRRKRTG